MADCYICGTKLIKNKNKTHDHVPPQCIFPKNERPPNLITVLCCNSCHDEFDILDERMRNYLAILAGKNSGEVGSKAEKVVLNSPKLRKKFLSHTKKHPSMVDSDGNPRLLFFFDDEELQRWLIRVVKGIFFYRNKRRISDKAIYSIEKHPEFRPPSSMTFPMEDGLELRPYFTYGIVQESSYDFWVLIFYDHLIFTVTVETPTSKN